MKAFTCAIVIALAGCVTAAQERSSSSASAKATADRRAARDLAAPIAATTLPPEPPLYVIGPDDVLQILFWRDKELSGEFIVRPDGKISLPLLNDVHAAGLTPDQLRAHIVEGAKRFVEDPNATVVVKQINSRKVFITGAVEKPGTYALTGRMSVLHLIAMAGGLREYAKADDITILRREGARESRHAFKYKQVIGGKALHQNIELRPGDTVIVPE
jgi:polysaccharide export outer membrane protein